jgi:SAM-dependent methyltransferase
MNDSQSVNQAVAQLYNTFPFPPDPLSNDLPPGYNWRWSWTAAYNFCTGRKPTKQNIRVLDAGCGTGSGTDYLINLNPEAEIVAIDISEKALSIAKERCQKSGVLQKHQHPVTFKQMKIEDAVNLEGEFDLINSVGVLHHLPDPIKGIQSLAVKLAPGGLLHIFVYAELGRWGINLMQQAIALLQGNKKGDYKDGVKVGRDIFATLPENNLIAKYEREHWAFENQRDECFADMYVHPQEVDYNIDSLFALIDASGLEFVGFSNPSYWQIERLLGKSPELMERVANLSERQRYRSIELLDPSLTHYEFFLARSPLEKLNWQEDEALLKAIPERHPCMDGYPSLSFFDYNYQLIQITEAELAFLQACDAAAGSKTVGELLTGLEIDLEGIRSMQARQLAILS